MLEKCPLQCYICCVNLIPSWLFSQNAYTYPRPLPGTWMGDIPTIHWGGPWENTPLPIMISSGSDKAFPGFCFSAENFPTQKERNLKRIRLDGRHSSSNANLGPFQKLSKWIRHQFDTPSSSRTGLVVTSTNNKRPPQWGWQARKANPSVMNQQNVSRRCHCCCMKATACSPHGIDTYRPTSSKLPSCSSLCVV